MRTHAWSAAFLIGLTASLATAQTPVVPYNHLPSGNFTFRSLDLNTASRDDLIKLPGIDRAAAQRIISGRPYRAAHDLVDRKIISASTYARVDSRVVVTAVSR
jgi:DNA uptake protein ComE-like DNA-binding protein